MPRFRIVDHERGSALFDLSKIRTCDIEYEVGDGSERQNPTPANLKKFRSFGFNESDFPNVHALVSNELMKFQSNKGMRIVRCNGSRPNISQEEVQSLNSIESWERVIDISGVTFRVLLDYGITLEVCGDGGRLKFDEFPGQLVEEDERVVTCNPEHLALKFWDQLERGFRIRVLSCEVAYVMNAIESGLFLEPKMAVYIQIKKGEYVNNILEFV